MGVPSANKDNDCVSYFGPPFPKKKKTL
jgi:hypothetical protein